MFFVQKGDCTVRVKDRINDIIEERDVRILNPGDHFGVNISSSIYNFLLGNLFDLSL